jgi:hypothetical protein
MHDREKEINLLHPANRLLAWVIVIVSLSLVSIKLLAVAVVMIGLTAMRWVPTLLWRSLRRMRWLLLALIITFAWSTPGVYITSSWYAPSIEGIYAGVEQALRLIGIVASLQIALYGMNQTMLLSACYQLGRVCCLPDRINARFAMRLGLTLQYAEHWLMDTSTLSWQNLSAAFDDTKDTLPADITVEIMPFSRTDRWVSVGLALGCALLLISRVGT